MSKMIVFGVVVGMSLALALAQDTETPKPASQPVKIPAEIKAAQDKVFEWVNSLYGKTEAEIIAELGDPTERGTDRDGDLLLKYSTAPKASLHLYFSKRQRVILASYGVTS